MYKGDAMQNVFLINASLVDSNITEAIRGLISNAVVVYTFSVNEFIEKANYYSLQPDVDIIYAVGGDGTVNLLANILVNTNKKLGIVPIGHNNKIYKSVKNEKKIDIGYINDKLFLNHAIIVDAGFELEKVDYSSKFDSRELKCFEFVTNACGKYKMMSANSIVMSNGFLNPSKCSISDNVIETYFLQNKKIGILKNSKDLFISKDSYSVDLLGVFPIIIDGDIYSISKFDFNLSKKQLEVETKELNKQMILVKN